MEIYYETELYHHGIKGQKWGVRRFQNKDGSLTPAGRRRQLSEEVATRQRELRKDAYDRAVKGTKLGQYEAESDAILKKWGLDADDGGGGRDDTPASVRKRYMDLQEKIDKESETLFTAKKQEEMANYVHKKLESEFGKEGIRALEANQKKQDAIYTSIVLGSMAGTIGASVLVYKGGKWVLKKAAHGAGKLIGKAFG